MFFQGGAPFKTCMSIPGQRTSRADEDPASATLMTLDRR